MLKANIWTEKGLCNGAIGRIVHILYEEGANPLTSPPSVLICTFHSYNGPYLDEEKKTVPITPITRGWTASNGETCSRTQFPIYLSYACSIHQSQGLTLDKVIQ